MPDQWDFDTVSQSINFRIRDLNTRLDEIRKYKLKKSESYKKEHDEIIGKLFVNYGLQNDVHLMEKSSYVSLLRSLLTREPPKTDPEMFNYDTVKNGWRFEIQWKLKNVGEEL